MEGHRLVDPLAADQSGPDQVTGVMPVGVGAGRAAALPSGSTGLQEDTVRERVRREPERTVSDLALSNHPTDAHRVPAPVAALALTEKLVPVTRVQSCDEGLQHLGVDLVHDCEEWDPARALSTIVPGQNR
jgi:hypothetical protein